MKHETSAAADAPRGETTAAQHGSARPSLPHEHDESSHSQAQAAPVQKEVGDRAYGNATDGTQDTDRGPAMDKMYNEKVAPDRGSSRPRE